MQKHSLQALARELSAKAAAVKGGRVALVSGGQSWEGRDGDLLIVPDAPHGLRALHDSVILLTVAKLP